MYSPQKDEIAGVSAHVISEPCGLCFIFNLFILTVSGVHQQALTLTAHPFELSGICGREDKLSRWGTKRWVCLLLSPSRLSSACCNGPIRTPVITSTCPLEPLPHFRDMLLPRSSLQKEVQLIHNVVGFVLNELACPGHDLGVGEMCSNACHRALAFIL